MISIFRPFCFPIIAPYTFWGAPLITASSQIVSELMKNKRLSNYLIVTFFKKPSNFRWHDYFFIHDYTLDDRQVTKVTDVVVSVRFTNKPMFFHHWVEVRSWIRTISILMNMKSMKSGLKTNNSSYIQKKVTRCILLIKTNRSFNVDFHTRHRPE